MNAAWIGVAVLASGALLLLLLRRRDRRAALPSSPSRGASR
jgi:LPXTG-motif cell wall-anchored protein